MNIASPIATNGRKGAPGKGHTPRSQTTKRRAATTYMSWTLCKFAARLVTLAYNESL